MASSASPKRVVLLAAEPSADALGASVAEAWRVAFPDVQLLGMAGPLMRAAGVQALWRMEEVSVMGLFEVLKHYRRLKRLQMQMIETLKAMKPDLVLGIDGPDFNLTIESALRDANIPSYHFVAPTVWAWRPGRALKMAERTDGLLCLFPFEPPYFLVHGLAAASVGHPLADRLPLVPDKTAARMALNIATDVPVLAVLPGSRRGEWQYNAPAFWDAVSLLLMQYPSLQVLVPCLNARMQQVLSAGVKDLPIHWMITEAGASQVLTAADVALVASGTATLETALCHTPMVVGYRMHWLSHRIITAMLKTRWIALPNIIANRGVVPELLQSQATGAALAAEVSKLLSPSSELRQVQLNWFDTLHNLLHCNAAATAVTQLISWWRERVR